MNPLENILNQTKSLHQRLSLRWLLGLGTVLGFVFVFAKLAEDVWFKEGFAWDPPIILWIHHLSTPFLDILMKVATQMGSFGAISITLIGAGWFYKHQQKVNAYALMASLMGAVALNTILKVVFARPRPSLFPPLVNESGFSFPSGHVTASVAVYGFFAVYLWQNHHRGWAIFSAAWIGLVAFTRIYLGVHYPSDTLAAMAFTSLWLLVVFYVRERSGD